MNFEKMVTLHFQKTGVGKKTYVTKKNTIFFFFLSYLLSFSFQTHVLSFLDVVTEYAPLQMWYILFLK